MNKLTYAEAIEKWRYEYPLTNAIMNNEKLSEEQVIRLINLGQSRR